MREPDGPQAKTAARRLRPARRPGLLRHRLRDRLRARHPSYAGADTMARAASRRAAGTAARPDGRRGAPPPSVLRRWPVALGGVTGPARHGRGRLRAADDCAEACTRSHARASRQTRRRLECAHPRPRQKRRSRALPAQIAFALYIARSAIAADCRFPRRNLAAPDPGSLAATDPRFHLGRNIPGVNWPCRPRAGWPP